MGYLSSLEIRTRGAVVLLLVTLFMCGCSQGASRLQQQSLSPGEAAAKAIETYDENGDGILNPDELTGSPSLLAALGKIDTDGDGQMTESEIAARLNQWVDSRIALFTVPCQVYLDGQPLSEATVRFEPEPFLGNSFQVVEGMTTRKGGIKFQALPGMPAGGLPPGLYRIRVTKMVDGKQIIPSLYNEQTILGQEIANDAEGMERTLEFRLSKNN